MRHFGLFKKAGRHQKGAGRRALQKRPRQNTAYTVFCPGLKKGTVLLEGKGHFRARNYILRALLRAELHYEGTFVHGIIIRRKKIIILLVQYSNHIFG